jgi:hypothetical protein
MVLLVKLTFVNFFYLKEQHMRRALRLLIIVPLLITFCIISVLTPGAQATVIDTQTILNSPAESPKAEVQAFLAREEVREQMVALGVDPVDARGRIAALTDQELSLLQQHINDLPAGASALAVLGAVFLVLIVLELVGVTNVFSKL